MTDGAHHAVFETGSGTDEAAADQLAANLAAFRTANVPLFNAQPLKLGLFAINLNGSVLVSSVPSSFEVTWEHSLAIAREADRIGFEVIVPAARYRGYGGATNLHGRTFETLTYAAGLLASTEQIMVFSTVHASVVNPIMAAKAIVTLDHISRGRAGLNIVMGWNADEMAMLGLDLREHGDRYGFGAEWIEVVERIWTEREPFDFTGKHLTLTSVQGDPKPVQPKPILINAGASPAGIDFSARFADFNFTIFDTEEHAAGYVRSIRDLAWNKYRRQIGMLTTIVIVCRETETEAKAAYQAIVDHADWTAAHNYIATMGIKLDTMGEQERATFLQRFVSSAANRPLVGTPEQVVEGLRSIKNAGIDGVLIGLADYVAELPFFESRVLPLMREAGLRIADEHGVARTRLDTGSAERSGTAVYEGRG